MANFLFDAYRNSVIGKTSDYSARVDMDTDTIKAVFVDHGTATPLVTHVFLTSFSSGANPTFANAPTLGSPTVGSVAVGVFDAADLVFSGGAVLTGSTSVESLVIFKNVTVVGDSPNLAYFDTATGLPLVPNGADVTVVWSASGIFKF